MEKRVGERCVPFGSFGIRLSGYNEGGVLVQNSFELSLVVDFKAK